MALKGERVILESDITQTAASAQTRGVTLCYNTSGSGVALGAKAGSADVLSPSGKAVAGLLMNDVVDVDLTRYHLNFHKNETLKGNRCELLRKGRVTTDQIVGSPNPGDTAYLTTLGRLTPTVSATGGVAATPKVGRFAGTVDENGFGTVDINLPA